MTETRPLAAATMMIAAMAIIGLIDNFVIVVAETHGLWQFHIVRMIIALPLIFLVARLGFGTLRPRRLWAVAGRSALVGLAMVLYFGCLAFLPIAEVAAGLFTAPLWVLVLSVLGGRERVGPVRASAALLGFFGVLLVLKPDSGTFSSLSLVPLAAGFSYALGVLSTRAWCAQEGTSCLLAGNFFMLALFSGLGLLAVAVLDPAPLSGPEGFLRRGWLPLTSDFLFWVFVQAAGAVLGVGLLIRSYQIGEASFSATFEYTLLVSVSIWAYVLRGETVGLWTAAGIALIIVSGAAIALRGR